MSDTSGQIDPDRSVGQGPGESQVPEPARRKRRGLRITLVSLASLVVFLGAVAVGGYVFVNHLAGGIHLPPSPPSRSGVFVTAPTYTAAGKTYLRSSLAGQLWTAIRQDSIAAFAKKYPSTVTPNAPH